jgi:hypothetical protein
MPSLTTRPQRCALEFTFALTGLGWAQATITDLSNRSSLTASYLSDALGNLLDATISIATQDGHAEFVWEEEPGEYRWQLDRGNGVVKLEIHAADFPADWDDELDEDGPPPLVFQTTVTPLVFTHAIAAGERRALNRHGEAQYERQWGQFPFPTASLERLESLVNTLSDIGG